MSATEIQEQIESTNYWDEEVIDIQVKHQGSEVEIYYGEEKDAWKLTFKGCGSLQYKSYLPSEELEKLKERHPGQFDYFGHEILVEETDREGFYLAKIDFQFIEMQIEFRIITVEKVYSEKWFWNDK